MINVGTLSKLRRMVRRDGLSVREASKKLGIARNTAARWLAMDEMVEPKYPKRVSVESILDPYKEQLINWLKSDIHRGKRERRTTKALFEAIRALGYSGSRGPVYEFCKDWQDERNKPRHAGFVPMSYELGEAFQFDWSCEYAFVEGLRRRLEVAHVKLAASRAFVMVAYYTQSHEMLFDAHARAFEIFGGIPKRGIYDNMKTAVDKVGAGKQRSVNARFESMTGHYPAHLLVVAADGECVTLKRSFERDQTIYDWTHYISLIERKPGALRNGAPFKAMPEPLLELQRQLLKNLGGDRVMAKVLSAVTLHGLEPVLVAVELALQGGRVSADHVLNILSRLQEPAKQVQELPMVIELIEPSQPDVHRYDTLRLNKGGDHVE